MVGADVADAFRREYPGRQPYAFPSTALDAVSIFSWDALDSVLRNAAAHAIPSSCRRQAVNAPTPRRLADAHALLKGNRPFHSARVVVRRRARRARSRDGVRGSGRSAHSVVRHGGTHGFGWHYDSEEVFIVQTDGAKDYYFRSNTIEPESANTGSDFSRFREETSQIGMARLNSRRLVVYPARWWHVAKCVEDSLSISIGIARGN